MIARTSNINTCRAPCTSAPSNTRRTRRPSHAHFACAQVKRLLQKQKQLPRVALAIKSDVNNKTVPPAAAADAAATPAAIGGVVGTTQLRLPRTLPRPASQEVKMSSIESAYPELKGVSPGYIRELLPVSGAMMLAGVSRVKAMPPTSSLPKELEIVMNDMVAAAPATCPTHMFAIHAPASPSNPTQKRKVTLFPVHQLVFASHCANLPALPPSHPSTSASTSTIPVVPLCLPSPEAFPLLQAYLYTKRADGLLASLTSPVGASSSPSPPSPSDTAVGLARQAMMVHGLWRNACALGVVDSVLYDVVDAAWEGVLRAMQEARL